MKEQLICTRCHHHTQNRIRSWLRFWYRGRPVSLCPSCTAQFQLMIQRIPESELRKTSPEVRFILHKVAVHSQTEAHNRACSTGDN